MKVTSTLERPKRILILGASGMLGSSLFRSFSAKPDLMVYGTIRESNTKKHFDPKLRDSLLSNIHLNEENNLLDALIITKPDFVINCIGIVKQSPKAQDYCDCISINSLLPHKIAKYCKLVDAKFIHFSTDCVFSGNKGMYIETDYPDAKDLYGRTKLLGEVAYHNAVTLRTSIIGHELERTQSLVDWFLSQSESITGYKKAIFSGLPTIEIARILTDYIFPNPSLSGLYHLSVDPISKFDLLKLIAEIYEKDIEIKKDEEFKINRSLNSNQFRSASGFKPKTWPELIRDMHHEYKLTH